MIEKNLNLPSQDFQVVKDILKKHLPNETIYAFGSRVCGKIKPFSDLDIAIMNNKPIDYAVFVALKNAFKESDLPIKVDLVEWTNTSDSFKKIILKCYYVLQE